MEIAVKVCLVGLISLLSIWFLYEKTKISEKRKLIVGYTIEFVVFSFVLIDCFGNFSLIKGDDGFNQYYPAFVYCGKYIREAIKSILHGNFILPQFDFSIGLGEGIIPALNYYGFGDPFMLISAICPVKYSAYAYSATILLKVYISGFAFLYYCNKRGCQKKNMLAGVLVYVVSNYSLYFGLMFPTYLNVLISLPMLCAGIDDILEKSQRKQRKISFALIFAVSFQALSGFYNLYMELIFAAFYAIIGMLCGIKRIKDLFINIGTLLLHVVHGILLSGVIFIPAVCGYIYSSRSGEFVWIGIKTLLHLTKQEYWDLISSILVPIGFSEIGLYIPAIAFWVMCVTIKKVTTNKDMKIVFFWLVLAYINTRVVSWVAGGFTNDVYYNRWIFSLIFVMAFMIVSGVGYLKEISVKEWGIFTGCSIIYLVGIALLEKQFFVNGLTEKRLEKYMIYLCVTVVEVVIFVVFTNIKKCKEKTDISYIIIGCGVVGVALNIYTIFGGEGYGACWNFKSYANVRSEILNSNAQRCSVDEQFGRMDIDGNSLNESLYAGYYGTSEYLSILNSNVVEFYEQYGIVSEMNGMTHTLTGLESRGNLEDLLSVVYYDDVKEDVILENENALPLGFTFDSYVTEETAKNMSVVDRNASVLESVILNKEVEGIQENTVLLEKEGMSEIPVEIEYQNCDREADILKVNENSKIILNIHTDIKGEGYFYANNFRLKKCTGQFGEIRFQDIVCKYRPGTVLNNNNSLLVCLGDMQNWGTSYEISFDKEAEYIIEGIHVFILEKEKTELFNEMRHEETLQNVVIENNEIVGEIETIGKKILFLSVPYSKGWKVYVNGEETEILKADYGFCALVLEGGENNICLKYSTPGMKAGIVCTLIVCMELVIYGLANIRRNKILRK
ncbi:MAG: YfhO family protein [Lachnospiraceae bacterium]|nr:YfhO family protein [Lachnospiraceae bacterium]